MRLLGRELLGRELLGRSYWYRGLLGLICWYGGSGTGIVSKVFMNIHEEEKEQEKGLSSPCGVHKALLTTDGDYWDEFIRVGANWTGLLLWGLLL